MKSILVFDQKCDSTQKVSTARDGTIPSPSKFPQMFLPLFLFVTFQSETIPCCTDLFQPRKRARFCQPCDLVLLPLDRWHEGWSSLPFHSFSMPMTYQMECLGHGFNAFSRPAFGKQPKRRITGAEKFHVCQILDRQQMAIPIVPSTQILT